MKKPQINDDKKKKWDNFWYYYKYHVLAGAFVLVCIIIFAKDMMSKIDYDYCVSVIGNYSGRGCTGFAKLVRGTCRGYQ